MNRPDNRLRDYRNTRLPAKSKEQALRAKERRLKYLSAKDVDLLHEHPKLAFGCLHGLIQTVEKEAGKLSKVVASITSPLVIGFAY